MKPALYNVLKIDLSNKNLEKMSLVDGNFFTLDAQRCTIWHRQVNLEYEKMVKIEQKLDYHVNEAIVVLQRDGRVCEDLEETDKMTN